MPMCHVILSKGSTSVWHHAQVLHCVMYPWADFDLPILSMDVVAKDGDVSLAIIDPCPASMDRQLPAAYNQICLYVPTPSLLCGSQECRLAMACENVYACRLPITIHQCLLKKAKRPLFISSHSQGWIIDRLLCLAVKGAAAGVWR